MHVHPYQNASQMVKQQHLLFLPVYLEHLMMHTPKAMNLTSPKKKS